MRLLLALAFAAACGGGTRPATTPSNTANPPRTVPAAHTDPDKTSTWTAKLGDPRESERAVTELEQLGDPSAIPALAEAWAQQGRPVRILGVIIALARPLTPAQAKAQYLVAYEASGRPASWDRALPVLVRAVGEIDDANPRTVDCAMKAADALGEAQLAGGLDPLVVLAHRPTTKHVIAAQIAAIRALGHFTSEKARAAGALVKLIDREAPQHPRTATDKEQGRQLEEAYALYLGTSAAAINAIAELRTASAAKSLVLALYRMPELLTQTRRALVASGPAAEKLLLAALRGDNADVNQLFKTKRLDQYCGDRGDAAQCEPVSAKDFYAAVVIGDFFDPAAVPDLLAALKRPALPAYYLDDQPSPNTQANALFDALRKIGAPGAAAPVRALWLHAKAPLETQVLAVEAYPFVTRDATGTDELGRIAADNTADDTLRQEAATAFARLARSEKDIALLQTLAQRYLDASAKKAKEAAGLKKDADAADAAYATKRATVDAARATLQKTVQDSSKSAQDIRAAVAAVKKLEDDLKGAKKLHSERIAPFRQLDTAAKAYLGFARMFQTHIARIEVAIRCNVDLACFTATLRLDPDRAAASTIKYIPDIATWSPDEKRELVAAAIDRAMLELGKQGAKASSSTDALLDAAGSDDRVIRQSILLALPKIAPLPCAACEAKLDAAVKADEGKAARADLVLETTILRNYFTWAGGKPPSD